MSVNYLEKGASRYLIGEAEPFDQKNDQDTVKRLTETPATDGLHTVIPLA